MRIQHSERGEIAYLHHAPAAAANLHVILAHGFFRSPETMSRIARALADQGIECASIRLHRSRLWSGNHAANARDMIALRKALGWDKVVYAGFSAGGLSAHLAAAEDPACVKLLLFDPVDQGTLGVDAAPKIRVPALAILGQPGPGNAHRNASPMLRGISSCRIVTLPTATHCDFEADPSVLCYRLTGSRDSPSRIAAVHAAIIQHSTAFLTANPAS